MRASVTKTITFAGLMRAIQELEPKLVEAQKQRIAQEIRAYYTNFRTVGAVIRLPVVGTST